MIQRGSEGYGVVEMEYLSSGCCSLEEGKKNEEMNANVWDSKCLDYLECQKECSCEHNGSFVSYR